MPLLCVAGLLLWVNLGVLFLLPHPLRRYKEYKTTQRIMTRSVALMAVNAVQFACMALGPVAFLCRRDGLAACALGAATLLYALTIAVCCCELVDFPWEESAPGRFLLRRVVAGRGPAARSTLVANVVPNPDGARDSFAIILGVLLFATVQSASQCRRFLLGAPGPDPGLEDFFPAVMAYSTVVMSASFFSFTQFDPATTGKAVYIWDMLLGVVLPTLVTALGPRWMGNGAGASFAWQRTFWTRSALW